MAVGGSNLGRGLLFVGAWLLGVSSAAVGCTTASEGASNQRESTDTDAEQNCSVDDSRVARHLRPTHPFAPPSGCRSLLCEDVPDFVCPEGTECNSRGVNAEPTGCAPIGDEIIPSVPAPVGTTDPVTTTPSPNDGPGLPTDPEPVFVPEANGGEGSDDTADDTDAERPAPGSAGSQSDDADDPADVDAAGDSSGPNSNDLATSDPDDASPGVCVPRN